MPHPDQAGAADSAAPSGHLMAHLLGFLHLLRTMGVAVGPGQAIELARALEHVPITSREDFRAAARCTLIRRRDDLPLFEAAFAFFWRTPGADPLSWLLPQTQAPGGRRLRLPGRAQAGQPGDAQTGASEGQPDAGQAAALSYSAGEQLRSRDFGSFSAEEVAAARQLIRRLAWRIDRRPTRRHRPARRGRRLDFRRVLARSLRHGGTPLELRWRAVRRRQRPLVVLCDISGSMERYSRILLQFLHAISGGLRDVESFVFGTRLTRISRLLQRRDIDDAVALVGQQVQDWSGGTRIGETLKTFNYVWGRRVLGRGAAVLLISDGWDRGDPQLLAREMARLQRSCFRLIWLNPLLGNPEYRPLTQGMRAALPYVDDFLPVHNLRSLEQLGELLAGLSSGRPARRQRRL